MVFEEEKEKNKNRDENKDRYQRPDKHKHEEISRIRDQAQDKNTNILDKDEIMKDKNVRLDKKIERKEEFQDSKKNIQKKPKGY